MKKAYLNWSSGKDAAFALYKTRDSKEFKVEKLITTISSETGKISMHGVHLNLLLKQAEQIGIPLHLINLPEIASLEEYNKIMDSETSKLISQGFTHSIFGDIFLEDLKKYRENQLGKVGLQAVFPLWNMDTKILLKDFIAVGFKAIVVCVNAKLLDKSFCGRIVDENFLSDLPANIDPCGENGEFHTFVFDGPIFKKPVDFKIGKVSKKSFTSEKGNSWDTSFWFCDLINSEY